MGFGPPGGIAGAGQAGGIYWGKGKKGKKGGEGFRAGRRARGTGFSGCSRGRLRRVLGLERAKRALDQLVGAGAKVVSWGTVRVEGPSGRETPNQGMGGEHVLWDGRMDTCLGIPPINPHKPQVRARCSLLTAQEGRARIVIINNH